MKSPTKLFLPDLDEMFATSDGLVIRPSVSVCQLERERESETDRETDRQRERERETETACLYEFEESKWARRESERKEGIGFNHMPKRSGLDVSQWLLSWLLGWPTFDNERERDVGVAVVIAVVVVASVDVAKNSFVVHSNLEKSFFCRSTIG